ncbi:hypothetical protein A0H81_10839 [Grifola frondosa]|uniref:Uncharacterized protein n=1 Tax=Grifola frondosa TaxID=5627 RepID=A0A1C7LYI7_GRIFR|nr:hypothetical protein A0H81_10839 [Grifola frondosa]
MSLLETLVNPHSGSACRSDQDSSSFQDPLRHLGSGRVIQVLRLRSQYNRCPGVVKRSSHLALASEVCCSSKRDSYGHHNELGT